MSRKEFCLSKEVSDYDLKQFINLQLRKGHKTPKFQTGVISDHFSWKFHSAFYSLIPQKDIKINLEVQKALGNLYFYGDLLQVAQSSCDEIESKVKVVERVYNLSGLYGSLQDKYQRIRKMYPESDIKSDTINASTGFLRTNLFVAKLFRRNE